MRGWFVLAALAAGCGGGPATQPPARVAYRDEVLKDKPVAYYEFADGARDSAGAHHGAVKGGVTIVAGAAQFDGESGRVQVPAHADFRSIGAGPFTIELWFKAAHASRGDLINYKAEEGYNDLGVFSCHDAEDQVSHYEGQAVRASTEGVAVGAWHHVAVVRDAKMRITLWIDGKERDAGDGEMSWDYDADLLIGCNHIEGDEDQITIPFAGWIDEVAIYRTALARERIEAHFRAAGGGPTTAEPKKPEPAKPAGPKPQPASDSGFTPLKLADFRFHFDNRAHDASKTYREQDGVVMCTGRPAGYMYTAKSWKQFTLRFDWRYKRPVTLEDDAKFGGNSGYLLFIAEHRVWPRALEIQGMNRDAGHVIPIRIKAKFDVDRAAHKGAIKAVGEWNAMEIVSKGGTITTSINGARISTVTECELSDGPIGFQSEGAEIHWANIRIRQE